MWGPVPLLRHLAGPGSGNGAAGLGGGRSHETSSWGEATRVANEPWVPLAGRPSCIGTGCGSGVYLAPVGLLYLLRGGAIIRFGIASAGVSVVAACPWLGDGDSPRASMFCVGYSAEGCETIPRMAGGSPNAHKTISFSQIVHVQKPAVRRTSHSKTIAGPLALTHRPSPRVKQRRATPRARAPSRGSTLNLVTLDAIG